jgi:fructokinase
VKETSAHVLLGVDLGGTKIECAALSPTGEVLLSRRLATPQGDYDATLRQIATLLDQVERELGLAPGRPLGVGIPGSVSPASGRIRNANSVVLNGRPLQADLEALLRRPLRLANDANCLAVSEAADGAAAGAQGVFAVILGTGVGGGIVLRGALWEGGNAIAGEWGHNPLPWPRPDWGEVPGPDCWCGRRGCIEAWLSGPALAADHLRHGGTALAGEGIVAALRAGDGKARASFDRYCDRLARALAHLINLLDPEVIVLGGGLSRIDEIYVEVPRRWARWIFSDTVGTRLLPARHGDASGVRGAAWLWR